MGLSNEYVALAYGVVASAVVFYIGLLLWMGRRQSKHNEND
mgnify:CR=1 FL=1